MDEFKYYETNNRARMVGKVLSMPQFYLRRESCNLYAFYINTDPNKINLVPIVCKENAIDFIQKEFKIGDEVVIHGRCDYSASLKDDDYGVCMKIYEQYVYMYDIAHKEREFEVTNVIALYGKLLRDPLLKLTSADKEITEIILHLPSKRRYTNILTSFGPSQTYYTKDLQQGDEIGLKCKMISVFNKHFTTRICPTRVFKNKEHGVLDNPSFIDLDVVHR